MTMMQKVNAVAVVLVVVMLASGSAYPAYSTIRELRFISVLNGNYNDNQDVQSDQQGNGVHSSIESKFEPVDVPALLPHTLALLLEEKVDGNIKNQQILIITEIPQGKIHIRPYSIMDKNTDSPMPKTQQDIQALKPEDLVQLPEQCNVILTEADGSYVGDWPDCKSPSSNPLLYQDTISCAGIAAKIGPGHTESENVYNIRLEGPRFPLTPFMQGEAEELGLGDPCEGL